MLSTLLTTVLIGWDRWITWRPFDFVNVTSSSGISTCTIELHWNLAVLVISIALLVCLVSFCWHHCRMLYNMFAFHFWTVFGKAIISSCIRWITMQPLSCPSVILSSYRISDRSRSFVMITSSYNGSTSLTETCMAAAASLASFFFCSHLCLCARLQLLTVDFISRTSSPRAVPCPFKAWLQHSCPAPSPTQKLS